MVKVKKSILSRIFSRGAGDAVDASSRDWPERRSGPAVDRNGSRLPKSTPTVRKPVVEVDEEIVELEPPAPTPTPAPTSSKVPSGSADSGKVLASTMGREEELGLALKQGFDGISDVLDGIDRKIDKHQKTSDEIMISVRNLPEVLKSSPDSSKAGVELLARISAVLESQGKTTRELLDQMHQLPSAIEQLNSQLGEQVAEIVRGHKNVDRTMHETQRQMSNAFSEIQRTVDRVATDQTKTQQQVIAELRVQQQKQDERVEELMQRSSGAMRLVVFLLVLSIAALLLVVNQISH